MNGNSLNIENWRNKLGLFPMPLFQDKFLEEKFVLLNGGMNGDLCIDFKNNEDIISVRNYAWSADVGHYLIIDKDKKNVSIHRWDSVNVENYDIQSVENKFESFYNYLRKREIIKQDSIIKFGIQFYRKIRTLLRDNMGNDSLNVLLYFFACVAENAERNTLSIKKWSLSQNTKAIAIEKINNIQWDELIEMLRMGLKSRGLKPNIDLILRHSSGSLFQEAHFETLFPTVYQQSLFIPNGDKILNKKRYEQTSAHYTPTSIVRAIVEVAIRDYSFNEKKEISIFDPACGSGEFFKEFIRQVKLKGFKGKIKIFGWDISETAIDMANFIVNYEAQPNQENIEFKIIPKDALINGSGWNLKVDFLLMNPPFISWELMNLEQQEYVTSILGKLIKNKPNTAGAFLWNAVNCLNENGVIGCVLPTSIFENDSYVFLREELKNIIDIDVIGRLGSHSLFSNALVDAAILVGTKKQNKNHTPLILWSDYKSESASKALRELRKIKSSNRINLSNDEGYSLYENPNLINNNNWMPIPFKSFELLNKFKSFTKVEDIFNVKQGARTGLNAAFVIPKSFYLSLSIKEKKYFRPAVTNESISNSNLNDNYYIFSPLGDTIPVINTDKDLEKIVPVFYNKYLLPNYKKLINRKGIKEWWELTRPRNWQKGITPKIVSKEFGKAGSFAYDKTGIFVAERSHAWFPKKDDSLGEIGYGYVTILAMPIIDDFLTGISKQIGGGQWYLSSKYINNMPMPDLFDNKKYNGIKDDLIDLGIQLSDGINIDTEQLLALSKFIFNV